MAEDIDQLLRNISASDQLAQSITQIAAFTADMFQQLQLAGMTRAEAFLMTQTFLAAIIARAGKRDE